MSEEYLLVCTLLKGEMFRPYHMSHDVIFTTDSIYYLEPETNSIVYEILEESNAIIAKYSETMNSLKALSFPSSFKLSYLINPEPVFKKSREELNRIGDEITELDQKHLIPWIDKSSNFALNPSFKLRDSLEPVQAQAASSHWSSYLRHRDNQLVDSIKTLYFMHHNEYDRFQTKLSSAYQLRMNFWFASSGYLLAFILALFL